MSNKIVSQTFSTGLLSTPHHKNSGKNIKRHWAEAGFIIKPRKSSHSNPTGYEKTNNSDQESTAVDNEPSIDTEI